MWKHFENKDAEDKQDDWIEHESVLRSYIKKYEKYGVILLCTLDQSNNHYCLQARVQSYETGKLTELCPEEFDSPESLEARLAFYKEEFDKKHGTQ